MSLHTQRDTINKELEVFFPVYILTFSFVVIGVLVSLPADVSLASPFVVVNDFVILMACLISLPLRLVKKIGTIAALAMIFYACTYNFLAAYLDYLIEFPGMTQIARTSHVEVNLLMTLLFTSFTGLMVSHKSLYISGPVLFGAFVAGILYDPKIFGGSTQVDTIMIGCAIVGFSVGVYYWRRVFENTLSRLQGSRDEMKSLKEQTEKVNQQLLVFSSYDSLTGLPNRRSLDAKLVEEWNRLQRTESPLSLVMIDVDHFKLYNDHHGHLRGDDVLKEVARTLHDTLRRATDMVGRFGGEEFLFIFPDTDRESAIALAEKMRTNVESKKIVHESNPDESLILTISLGVATLEGRDSGSLLDLLEQADKNLYRAKSLGRNRTCY